MKADIEKKAETEVAQKVQANKAISFLLEFLRNNGTLVALIALGLFFSFADESFFTPRNISNLARQTTIIGIIAVGMTMVILINGIDLSVGSIVGLSAIVVTMSMQAGLSMPFAILLTILVSGVLIGLWNGFWVAHYDIPPFIITLGMMTIARGLALTLSGGGSIPVIDSSFAILGGGFIPATISAAIILCGLTLFLLSLYRTTSQKRRYGITVKKEDTITTAVLAVVGTVFCLYVFTSYRGIPYPVAIFGVIAFIGMFMLQNTKFGRRLYAMGGNEEAARLSGINVYRMKLIVYSVVTVLSALSGILLASRLNGASPNLGNMFELDAISAVIIGGTSFSGGVGTIGGTVIGTLIIGVLTNGMSLLGVPTFYQYIIKGFIIILAVWFDVLQKRRR